MVRTVASNDKMSTLKVVSLAVVAIALGTTNVQAFVPSGVMCQRSAWAIELKANPTMFHSSASTMGSRPLAIEGHLPLSRLQMIRFFGLGGGGDEGEDDDKKKSSSSSSNDLPDDLFEFLGISRDADDAALNSAHRKMVMKYHPDRDNSEEAKKMMLKINRAYDILKHPIRRKLYAKMGVKAAENWREEEGDPFQKNQSTRRQQQGTDLSDIFSSFFGGGGASGGARSGKGRRRREVAGTDLRHDLEIDFQKSIFGGHEKVRIRHLETCDTCGGDGAKPGTQPKKCTTCGGAGTTVQVVQSPIGQIQAHQVCASCRGEGEVIEHLCSTCGGEGVSQKTKQVKVNIPPGVEDGNKLRVRGEGDAGKNGGPPGDLYIFLKVQDHPTFRRDGTEIYSEENISYLDAILGSSIKTPVVDGEVTIEIPPGTQPGQIMRLEGNGAPRLGNNNDRGDHYVTINVSIPKDISQEERAVMEKLRQLRDRKGEAKGFFS